MKISLKKYVVSEVYRNKYDSELGVGAADNPWFYRSQGGLHMTYPKGVQISRP
jgi:hypothetical protein